MKLNKNKFSKLKDNEVIHCETEAEAIVLLKRAYNAGYHWSSGKSFIRATFYSSYKSETCYDIINGLYGKKSDLLKKGYTIIPVSEFL